MKKRALLLIMLIVGMSIGVIIGLFFRAERAFGIAPLSADKVYIEKLEGAGFSEDGELRKCYWVVTFTVDVRQSHFFILDPDFSYIGEVINEVDGKKVIPTSTINITFVPLTPYYSIHCEMIPVRVMPEVYDYIQGQPSNYTHDPYIVYVYEVKEPYTLYLHTPFKIIIEKNGRRIYEDRIDAVGLFEQQYEINDNIPLANTSEGIVLATIGKLTSGITQPFGEFIYFGKLGRIDSRYINKPLALKRKTLDGKYIIDLFQYKDKVVDNKDFPGGVRIPDIEAMGELHYFRYWTGCTGDVYTLYHFGGPDNGGRVNYDDPALGHIKPRTYQVDVSGFPTYSCVNIDFCHQYPAWTEADCYEVELWPKKWTECRSAYFNYPDLIMDNPGTTPVGKSIYSWLVQDARAEEYNFSKLVYVKDVQLVGDELRVYCHQGSVGWDVVQLRIPTELADTYVYGQYMTKFEIDKESSYWERTGTLTDIELIHGVSETLKITIRNTGQVSAFAHLICTPIKPKNLFSSIELPTNILSDKAIEPGTTYTFELPVILKGTLETFEFSFEVSVWCEAEMQDKVTVSGKAMMSAAKLIVYTIGDGYEAKIWLNDMALLRNKGTYFEGMFPPGKYTIRFEVLENFTAPQIYVDNVHVGYEQAEITLREGMTTVVKAIYASSTEQLIVEFVSWDDKGLFGLSPTFNPLPDKRPHVGQYHVVRLKINVISKFGTTQGNLRIVILTDNDKTYTASEFTVALGSGASRIYDCEFMLGDARSYHFRVEFQDTVIYYDSNPDTRPEIFVIPWYLSELMYYLIGGGIIVIVAIAVIAYLSRRRV